VIWGHTDRPTNGPTDQRKNSVEIADAFRHKTLGPDDIMVSYDATGLFPNIPIGECIDLIYQKLSLDLGLPERTRLSPEDIRGLMRLCLSTLYFVYDDKFHRAEDSGPIGLSLMVTFSNIWMSHTLKKAKCIALERGFTIPDFIKKYIDDIIAILRKRPNCEGDPIENFRHCLNAVHPRVQFTFEKEKDGVIPFLDCNLKRLPNGRVVTSVYRKPTETNLVIKPESCHDPKILIGAFKTSLCRAYRLCSTPQLLEDEIQLLINIWEDNGFNRRELEKIKQNYRPPPTLQDVQNEVDNLVLAPQWAHHINTGGNNNSSIINADTNQNSGSSSTSTISNHNAGLIRIPSSNSTTKRPSHRYTVSLPYVPGISHALRRQVLKTGLKVVFRSGPKLRNLLCSKNKSSQPTRQAVYHISCDCNPSPSNAYIGQTRRKVATRMKEHQAYIRNRHFSKSGIAEHQRFCDGQVNFDKPKILATVTGKNRHQVEARLQTREAMEIRLHKTGLGGQGFNKDNGNQVVTNHWDPLLTKIRRGLGFDTEDTNVKNL
jgi:hypothetical protein